MAPPPDGGPADAGELTDCCGMDMPFPPGPMLALRGAGLGAPPGADMAERDLRRLDLEEY